MVRTLVRSAVLLAMAGLLCGFGPGFAHDLNAYRGEALRAAIARLGPPIQRSAVNGHRLYYWRVVYFGGVCKIWGIVDRFDVVTNWGYQDCATGW
jgi:hypothetical protein